MRRFFSFLMLLTAMTGLGSILQTAKAEYSGYQIESGYYYLKAVETATTRPGTVAQFSYLTRGDGKQYPYFIHGSADTELQMENPGSEMYPYLFKVEFNEEGNGYTFKNIESNLYLGVDNGNPPAACVWHVGASETACYFKIEYDEDSDSYRLYDPGHESNPFHPYLATGGETWLWYAETVGKANTYWNLLKVEFGGEDAIADAKNTYDTYLKACNDLAAKLKAGDAPGFIDSQETIDDFKNTISKLSSEVDKTSLESLITANIALNKAFTDVRSHINQIDQSVTYIISSASTKTGMSGQPMYFDEHNTYVKAGDYSGTAASDFKCLWTFTKVDDGYAICNVYGKQYLGAYEGEGADNASMLTDDQIPYTVYLNGDGTFQLCQADTWDAENSYLSIDLATKRVINSCDASEGQTLWTLTPVKFEIEEGYYYVKTAANNCSKANAYLFNNLAWWQMPQISETKTSALPTTPTEKETVYIFKVEKMNNGYSIQSVINNKYVGSVCQSYYLGFNSAAQQIDLKILSQGESGNIYQMLGHSVKTSRGSSIVPGDAELEEDMWCYFDEQLSGDEDESIFGWEFIKLDVTEDQLATLLKSEPYIPQYEYTGSDVEEGYYYLKAADCVTMKAGTIAQFGYLTRSDNKSYPYILHGSSAVEPNTDDITEDMFPYLFKVEKAKAGMGYTFKNLQSKLYMGLDNGAPAACLWHVAASETPCYFTLTYSEEEDAYRLEDKYTMGNQYHSFLATGSEGFLWYAETTGAQNTYWKFLKVDFDEDKLAAKVDAFNAAYNKYLAVTESAKVSDKPGYVSDAKYVDDFKAQLKKIKDETDLKSVDDVFDGITALSEAMDEFVTHINPIDLSKLYCIRSASDVAELKNQPIYADGWDRSMGFGDFDLEEEDPTQNSACLWSITQVGSNYYLRNFSTSQYMGNFLGDNETPIMTDDAVAYKIVFNGNGQFNLQQVKTENPESYLAADIETNSIINSTDNEGGKLNWIFEEVIQGLQAGYYYIQTSYNNTALANAYMYYEKAEAQRKVLLTEADYADIEMEPTAAEKKFIFKVQPLEGGGYTIQNLASGLYLGGQVRGAQGYQDFVLLSKDTVRIDLKMLEEIDEQNKACVINVHEQKYGNTGTTIVPGYGGAASANYKKCCMFSTSIPAGRDVSSYNWTFTLLDLDDEAAKKLADTEYLYEYTGDEVEDGFYYLKACDTNPTKAGTVAKLDYLERGGEGTYPYIVHGSSTTELVTSNVPESLYPYVFEVKMSDDLRGYTIKALQEDLYIGLINNAPAACMWHVAASEIPGYFTLEYDEDHDAYRLLDQTQGNQFLHVMATGGEEFLWYAETTGKENTYWQFIKIEDENLTGIKNQKVNVPSMNNYKFYNLEGMAIDKPEKGQIYIQNRRKIRK